MGNGLLIQWLINVFIPKGGTTINFPVSFTIPNYALAESRAGSDIQDVTGHTTKYTYGIYVNLNGDRQTDFIAIGF